MSRGLGDVYKRQDRLCFDQISTVGSDCFPSFPTHTVQSWLTFYHRSQHSLQHTVLKLLPEVMKSIRQQRKTVGTSKTLLFHDKASAYKAKVTVTFLKEQNIQVPAYAPTVLTWLNVTLVVPPHQREIGWMEVFLQSGCCKSSRFRAPCIVSIRLSKCL